MEPRSQAVRCFLMGSLLVFGTSGGVAVAADDVGQQSLLKHAQAISQIMLCGDLNRRSEFGARNPDDLAKVSASAQSGAPSCQYLLGRWNELGQGMPVNYAAAHQLYESAAAAVAAAYVGLGRMAELGRGREASASEALSLYQQASAKNEPAGDVAIGKLYERGAGVGKDLKLAAAYYRKAAARWDNDAWASLDQLQSSLSLFSPDEIATDRRLWRNLFVKRMQREMGKAPELTKAYEGRKSGLVFTFTRGLAQPAVTVGSSSGDPSFDAAISAVGQRVSMPPAPVYSASESTFAIAIPVGYGAQAAAAGVPQSVP
jgi:TPR repeat protein